MPGDPLVGPRSLRTRPSIEAVQVGGRELWRVGRLAPEWPDKELQRALVPSTGAGVEGRVATVCFQGEVITSRMELRA